ncbi:MAG: hypothetical protein ABID38_02915 [Candidatus Diapherotrites archaeon]
MPYATPGNVLGFGGFDSDPFSLGFLIALVLWPIISTIGGTAILLLISRVFKFPKNILPSFLTRFFMTLAFISSTVLFYFLLGFNSMSNPLNTGIFILFAVALFVAFISELFLLFYFFKLDIKQLLLLWFALVILEFFIFIIYIPISIVLSLIFALLLPFVFIIGIFLAVVMFVLIILGSALIIENKSKEIGISLIIFSAFVLALLLFILGYVFGI